MISLDIRTLSLITVLFCIIYGVGLIMYARAQTRFQGLLVYGVGNLAAGLGFALLSLRGFVNPEISIVTANSLIQLSTILMYIGLERFLKIKTKLIGSSFTLFGVLVIYLIYYTFTKPDVNMRIFVLSLTLAIQILFCAYLLFRDKQPETRLFRLLMATSFCIFSSFLLFRAFWTMGYEFITDFMSAGIVHGLAFLVFVFLISSSSLSLIFIAGKKLETELESQALTDALTGTLNRRALNLRVNEELAKANRKQTVLGVIITDIDKFKSVNDKYGHEGGDTVLKQFSHTIRDTLRQEDTVARVGGEEFIVLLPDSSETSAFDVAERLRKKIENLPINYKDKEIHITASFGVYIFHGPAEDSWDHIFACADKALYTAKANGRNMTVTYE